MSEKEKAVAVIEQYQNKPMIVLNPDAQYKFSFGLAKAKLIMEHLGEITAFVASEGKSLT